MTIPTNLNASEWRLVEEGMIPSDEFDRYFDTPSHDGHPLARTAQSLEELIRVMSTFRDQLLWSEIMSMWNPDGTETSFFDWIISQPDCDAVVAKWVFRMLGGETYSAWPEERVPKDILATLRKISHRDLEDPFPLGRVRDPGNRLRSELLQEVRRHRQERADECGDPYHEPLLQRSFSGGSVDIPLDLIQADCDFENVPASSQYFMAHEAVYVIRSKDVPVGQANSTS